MDFASSSPTANALKTLELLQTRPGITAVELSERLEVSDRAVRRYIAILREAGVPVDSTRGRYGGYRLGRGARVPPLVFTADEALGLVMAVLDGHHAAADPDNPVGSALGKLIRSLPGNAGRQAAKMREHARAAPDRSAARPDPAVTAQLIDAIAIQRRVRLTYVTSTGSSLETVVDPWSVVVRHGRWYLLCHAHVPDAPRTYRVDRIHALVTLTTAATTLPDTDPVAFLEHNLGLGWKHQTHVEFYAPIDDVRRHVAPPMGTLRPTADGSRCELVGTTSDPDMYAAEWLAPIPIPFHVVGGPELRHSVANVAHRLTTALQDR